MHFNFDAIGPSLLLPRRVAWVDSSELVSLFSPVSFPLLIYFSSFLIQKKVQWEVIMMP